MIDGDFELHKKYVWTKNAGRDELGVAMASIRRGWRCHYFASDRQADAKNIT